MGLLGKIWSLVSFCAVLMGLLGGLTLQGCASAPRSYCAFALGKVEQWQGYELYPAALIPESERSPSRAVASSQEEGVPHGNSSGGASSGAVKSGQGQSRPDPYGLPLERWAKEKLEQLEDEIYWIRGGQFQMLSEQVHSHSGPARGVASQRQVLALLRESQNALVELINYLEHVAVKNLAVNRQRVDETLYRAARARKSTWSESCGAQ